MLPPVASAPYDKHFQVVTPEGGQLWKNCDDAREYRIGLRVEMREQRCAGPQRGTDCFAQRTVLHSPPIIHYRLPRQERGQHRMNKRSETSLVAKMMDKGMLDSSSRRSVSGVPFGPFGVLRSWGLGCGGVACV